MSRLALELGQSVGLEILDARVDPPPLLRAHLLFFDLLLDRRLVSAPAETIEEVAQHGRDRTRRAGIRHRSATRLVPIGEGMGSEPSTRNGSSTPRVALIFAGAALVLVPWTVALAALLPSRHETVHWNLTWVGFDALLALVLALLALALVRRSPWRQHAGVAAAVFLACDTWFDVTTATPGRELVLAVLEATLIELPLAALCILIAIRTERARPRQIIPLRRRPRHASDHLKNAA